METNKTNHKASAIATSVGGSLVGALVALALIKPNEPEGVKGSQARNMLGGALGLGSVLFFDKVTALAKTENSQAFVAAIIRGYTFAYVLGRLGKQSGPLAAQGGVILGIIGASIVGARSPRALMQTPAAKPLGHDNLVISASGSKASDEAFRQFLTQYSK